MAFLTILQAFLATIALASASFQYSGFQVYRVFPQTQSAVKVLRDLQGSESALDFWTEPKAIGAAVDVNVGPDQAEGFLSALKEAGIKYEVYISDVEKLIQEENFSNQQHAFGYSGYDYGRYNRYNRMAYEMAALSRHYPSTTTLFTIGRTYEGKEIKAIKIQSEKGRDKKTVFIDCGIHAREWISPATCMFMMNKLITEYGKDDSITSTLNKFDFIIVPVFNVDGYDYTHQYYRLWRKTRKPYGYCFGADPNRNWGYKWEVGVGTSNSPCADTYRGPSAFSEVEVASVARYLSSIKDRLVSYYNIHAYSQLWLTPWSYTKRLPRDWDEISRVAKVAVDAISRPYGTRYRYGPPSRILYGVSGGSIDWTYGVLGVKYSYALELRDTGRYGFLLPANQILPTGRETMAAILAAVNAMRV